MRAELWLVALDGEQVVAASSGDEVRGVGLGVHRIDCDHDAVEVEESRSPCRAGISLLFAVTATCPRTAPAVWSNAATRCGAALVLVRAPRTVFPSMVMIRRPPATDVLVHR